tara:strand:+ start:2039 stop:2506 length:468 start_codon:yes stop_codon:yes gene_type:complete
MAFDWGKATAGDFKADSQNTTSANDITAKRKRLIQAINDHITANLNGESVLERKASKDEKGKIVVGEDGKQVFETVEKSRVTRMSNPTSKDGEVVCQLKYGNRAFVPLNGMDSFKIPSKMEDAMWKDVIEQIQSGKLDAAIEKAAKDATPTITKK